MNWRDTVRNYFPSGLTEPWRDSLPWEYLATAALLRACFPASARVLKLDCHDEFARKPCTGGLAQVLGPAVSLLELDMVVVDAMRKRGEPFDIHCGNILAIPWPDRAFDLVADFSTLDHVDPIRAPAAVREYYRVLAPGGGLLLFVWESRALTDIARASADGVQPYGPNHQFYFYGGTTEPSAEPSAVEEWADAAGFGVVLSKSRFSARGLFQSTLGELRQMTRYVFAKE